MYITSFPDLGWLKRQIHQNFLDQRGPQQNLLNRPGFPNVILHTQTTQTYRPNIKGPLSLFMNLSGSSYCTVDNHKVKVTPDFYFISNPQQHYDLLIDQQTPTTTFNIHFGPHFIEEVYSSLIQPVSHLLDGLFSASDSFYFYNKLYPQNPYIQRIIYNLQHIYTKNTDPLYLEEQLYQLLAILLAAHKNVLQTIQRLPATKKSTKTELYRRLAYAVDYIHSYSHQTIDLGVLAKTANLSKYHFLRLFKIAFGKSPYQYLQHLRLERAKKMLQATSFSIKEIAFQLGFENSSSFSRFFYRMMKVYPLQFR